MDVGLYGKLPSHGDFLRRRIADSFVVAWDAWLQAGIASSRHALGERWLDVYLTSPAWRFACSAGACGPDAIAGLMVPSVDRVGRYFPVTIAWRIPESITALGVATRCEPWFTSTERHVIETLAQEQVDFESFDKQLLVLGEQLDLLCSPSRVTLDDADAEQLSAAGASRWQVPIGGAAELGGVFEQLLYHRLRIAFEPLVFWWTEGSTLVAPSALMTSRLPAPDSFAALLDGSWSESSWRTVGAAVVADEKFVDTLVEDDDLLHYRSSALSDTGKVRTTNQDAVLERAEVGLWVVADGMGGHEAGEVASRMVCDALADLPPGETHEATIEAVRLRMDDVNAHLRRAAHRAVLPMQSGSTVVVMLARRARVTILWAGDSRAYRLRGGSLQQLTLDHAWAGENAANATLVDDTHTVDSAFAITRAVGGADRLDLDLQRDRALKGDRFLLCSDGLTRELDQSRLTSLLSEGDAAACAQQLVQATLAAGARDNVSVVVIDVA